MITKNNIIKAFYLFLFSHLFLWTAVPSLSNINLPLDTIEALAWGSSLDWGFNKHPPLSAFIIQLVYYVFGTQDWAYYLLSQVCVIISFFYVWKLSNDFFSNKIFSLLSLLILESIVFLNFTTPEFNVYVCQLPLKAITVYLFWRGINDNKITDWILLGIFSALGILTHYSFIFIIFALLIFFLIFTKKNKKIITNFLIALLFFILLISPHLIWLFENNFTTFLYALKRTGVESKSWINHIYNPIFFLLKQIGLLTLFCIMFLSIFNFKEKTKIKIKTKDKKKLFLFSISFLPILLVFIVSLITGAKIRTMWMSTFYLFFGLFSIYYLQNKINLKKINNFIYIFIFIFIFSPITYFYISISNDSKRTDYPGREIARLVQNKWDDNFSNNIKIVVGDEWSAGNLSYHLNSRPKWINNLQDKASEIKDDQGVIYVGNPKILKKVCPGVFGKISPVGYCMIGKR